MWNEEIHVIRDISGGRKEYIVAIDYGTSNPCAFLLISSSPKGVIVEKEYYYDSKVKGRQKTDAQYSKDLKEFLENVEYRQIILDPSAASFKAQLRTDGFRVRDADNSVIDGIRSVSTLLQGGRLQVHMSCINLIKEFSSYVWDGKKQAKGEDAPVKQFDHALDALRYGVQTMKSTGPIRATGRTLGARA
jgi:PBSX family phage terminase large subunit